LVYAKFSLPIDIHPPKLREGITLPRRIGFIVPFTEHDWYHNLEKLMLKHAEEYGIELEVVDTEKDMYDEVENRRKAIAILASEQVQAGEVLIIDSGPIAGYLANCLSGKQDLTVITNSTHVFAILNKDTGITLISTGGVLRRASQVLVGSTAESSLADLRADKLFLSVTGLSMSFGLSHSNYSEVSMKQAMIRSAREVILMADFTIFGQESIAQVCDLSSIQCVITDDSLPATVRLELTKQGIRLLLASS
jgi:DeoR/GlpR family transcriptional regulator of sugar metabolism